MKKVLIEMSPNRAQLLTGAVLIVIFSAIGGVIFMNKNSTSAILIAKSEIPSGISVTNSDFKLIEVVGDVDIDTVTEIVPGQVLKQPLKPGEILQSFNLIDGDLDADIVAFSIPKAGLPFALSPGKEVELWTAGDSIEPMLIGEAQLLQISESEFEDSSSISVLVQKNLVSGIFRAGSNIRIVIPSR